jgi:hypothetical protein
MNRWMTCLLFAAGVASGADSDLVNERFTTSGEDMETHWRIDCDATVTALTESGVQLTAQERAELADVLRKCGFIYQPPGADRAEHCPDYNRLLQALEKSDMPALAKSLEQAAACTTTLQ